MKEINIGREAGVPYEQARLAVHSEGKTTFLGSPGSVPRKVSRNHCKITIDDDGKMTVELVAMDNSLYINGLSYEKHGDVKPTDTVELGSCRYRLDLGEILKLVPVPQPALAVGHLRPVYDGYLLARKTLKEKQRKMNTLSRIPGVFSMASLLISLAFQDSTEMGRTIRILLYVIAFVTMIACIILTSRTARTIDEESERLSEAYREKCVCPNPACGRFLGQQYPTYRELIRYRSCPYCRSKFKE